MTASAALLAGLATSFATSANALPFNLQPQTAPQPAAVPQLDAARPVVARPTKPNVVTASRDKPAGKEKESAEDVASKAKGLLAVIISIDKQQLTLYSDGVPIAHSRVSTGQPGHSTPTGVFSIIQKDRWHHSNLYGDAPMFFMQRITWSGVAMHQGIVPNYPASHGCIRLPEAFARQMWGIIKLGARVIIARGEVTPVAISHARLFTIKREPLEAKLETKREPGGTSAEIVRAAHGALDVVQLVGSQRDGPASVAIKPGDPAFAAMAFAMVKPREATSSDAVKSAYDLFDQPRRAKFAANSGASSAGAEVRPLKPGPLSVFISRKEGKLFVRKGFEPLFNVPVAFEQPDKPLGTHVFTALAVTDDNTTLRWNVVSIPGGSAPVKKSDKKSEKGAKLEPTGPASNAAEALDRVTIPQDAIDRISELMSPGASLIVSDQGLGSETGVGTDFIVQTR